MNKDSNAILPHIQQQSKTTDENQIVNLSKIYIIDNNLNEPYDPVYKYNVLTGSYTPLCQDPLCEHIPAFFKLLDGDGRTECKFAGVLTVLMNGEWIYYHKTDEWKVHRDSSNIEVSGSIQSICAYNYVTHEFRVLYTQEFDPIHGFKGGLTEYFDGYAYFYLASPDPQASAIHLHRINVKTGDIEYMGFKFQYHHIGMSKDYIIFQDNLGNIFRTDHWFNDRVDLLTDCKGIDQAFRYTGGGYQYFTAWVEKDRSDAPDLYRVSIDGGEPEIMIEDISLGYLWSIDDKLYYYVKESKNERRLMHTDEDGRKYYSTYTGEIWRTNADGSKNEIIYVNENLDIRFFRPCGQYLAITYNEVKPDGRYDIADQKLVYDTVAEKWLEYK